MPMSKEEHDEACTVYAALALYDGAADITADSIKALINATGNEVEGYWPVLFARYLDGKIEDLIFNVSAGGGGGGGGGDAPAAGDGGGGEAAAEEKKEEEEEEEIDMGGGMDMFGDGGGGDDY
eukprot:CAMPEP_0197413886 /NCGR_PEP_ID=MMETSP1170-20131217/690_1 /TAXON_ID=54406 /ORGANISM="Sarcinochrysis sp, Strain CCMP770" /LENGTH=122 /DNA_ID=CAMNT_0042940539 /DNA_START=62 /DNA_END=430 /DNA_ORIENTATION=-